VEASRYRERDPHPGGQEAFTVRVRFPWHRESLCRIKVEITHDEPLALDPKWRALIHGYEEELATEILCYSLAVIVAEKMRALLQTQQRLAARGWHRPRARDYYDLWRILRDFGPLLGPVDLDELLRKKSAHRGVTYATLADFFTAELEEEARRHWTGTLSSFVAELPACDQVLTELKEFVPKHFRNLV
jgi:predicted nucleotidyltransferase component of viral defense system